jgi:hypothetical protein
MRVLDRLLELDALALDLEKYAAFLLMQRGVQILFQNRYLGQQIAYAIVHKTPSGCRPSGTPRFQRSTREWVRSLEACAIEAKDRKNADILRALIQADQFGLRDHMALHRVFQRGFALFAKIRQYDIECIQLEEVTMTADGRAWTAITGALPIVDAGTGSGWQFA